ncbi:MAG: hypothetical protein DWH84_06030 [Planctomycetota bacterium]|nr:MAG: hypothetical protein DWH84_06030 [Planctomycetota bacterium]
MIIGSRKTISAIRMQSNANITSANITAIIDNAAEIRTRFDNAAITATKNAGFANHIGSFHDNIPSIL